MKKIIAAILLIFVFIACQQTKQATTTTSKPKAYNFVAIYNPTKAALFFDHFVYINSDTSANVFFDITFNEANFNKNNQQIDDNKKQLNIRYVLRNKNNEITDSNTFVYQLTDYNNFSNYFNIKLRQKENYNLTIAVYDKQYRFTHRVVDLLDNFSNISTNKYLIQKQSYDYVEILKNKYILKDSVYKVVSPKTEELIIEYYKPNEYTLNPPYQININKKKTQLADTSFYYQTKSTIVFNKTGNYVFKNAEGKIIFNLLCSDVSYPSISNVGDMLEPIQIIATEKEYNKVLQSSDIKLGIDEYWLSLSKSQKFAKEQIRVFYNRVKLANIFFSEDVEGWKTDRGMIYILFGPPSVINLSDEGEDWYYGEAPNVAGVLFIFEKQESSTTKISYKLIRNNAYQPTWAQALNTWRKGRIFNLS